MEYNEEFTEDDRSKIAKDGLKEFKKSIKVSNSKKRSKSISIQKNTRIKIVAQELLYGQRPVNIIEKYSKEWKLSESSLLEYIRFGRIMIREEAELDPMAIKIDIISKYNELYYAARIKGDLKECRNILDSIMKLTQIKVTQVDINDVTIKTINLTEIFTETEVIEIKKKEE